MQVVVALARCRVSKLRVLLTGRTRWVRGLPPPELFHPPEGIPKEALTYLRRPVLHASAFVRLCGEALLPMPLQTGATNRCRCGVAPREGHSRDGGPSLFFPSDYAPLNRSAPGALDCDYPPVPLQSRSYFNAKQQYKQLLVHMEPPGRCALLRRLRRPGAAGKACAFEAGRGRGPLLCTLGFASPSRRFGCAGDGNQLPTQVRLGGVPGR